MILNLIFSSGLFAWDHMKYEYERESDDPFTGEPSLSEMVKVAIEMLSKNEDGFFLMVEGAKIDKGHHEGRVSKGDQGPILLNFKDFLFTERRKIKEKFIKQYCKTFFLNLKINGFGEYSCLYFSFSLIH